MVCEECGSETARLSYSEDDAFFACRSCRAENGWSIVPVIRFEPNPLINGA